MGFGSRPESGRRVQGSRWQIWLELLHVGPSYRCPCDRLGHHSLASRWFGRYCARGWGGGCLRAGCFDRIFRELFGLGCWGTTPCARCHSSMMSIRTLLLTTSMLSAPPPPPPRPPPLHRNLWSKPQTPEIPNLRSPLQNNFNSIPPKRVS